IPLVFIAFGFYLAASWLLRGWGHKVLHLLHPLQPDKEALRLGVMWAGADVLIAAPLGIYFVQHPGDLTERSSQVGALAGNQLLNIAGNALDAARMIGISGSEDLKYNLPGRPVFDIASSLLFYLGLVVCTIRARSHSSY